MAFTQALAQFDLREGALETTLSSGKVVQRPWSTIVPNLPHLARRWRNLALLCLGLLLFMANNLSPLAALLHPRAGYVALLVPRNHDSAQYLTWIEACKNSWTIPDYHAPWQTEPALHVPLMWMLAKVSRLTGFTVICVYLGLQIACYVLALYTLAFLQRVFVTNSKQVALAAMLMICSVPLRSFILLPALLLKPRDWAMMHTGYLDFLGGASSDGLFQGATCGAIITLGTAGALLSLAFFGRYFFLGQRNDLWAASLTGGLSGFFHPFEFIPVTAAAAFAILWKRCPLRIRLTELLIVGVPASAVVLFYFLATLTHPWLKIAADLNRFQTFHISHDEILALGLPVLLGVMFAFWPPMPDSQAECFLACYIVVATVGLFTTFLPWPQHFMDGLDYAAAIFVARKLDEMPRFMTLWASRTTLRLGLILLLIGGALLPHLYFRYLTYTIGITATEEGQATAVAPVDEVRAIGWLRKHADSQSLILAPKENAPWMATVPMHSFASHWIFSLTRDQQALISSNFFQGALSDTDANALLKSYGVRYVLIPVGSPALRYTSNAELRLSGQKLLLYEFPQNEMKPFPELKKVSPGRYVWNPS